ncbi:MAG: hypothetical protein IMZ70_07285 [Candidatus Atribacteria bacterium]|nr:hypothetical protein [Candidatus Atribacteria bacterium]
MTKINKMENMKKTPRHLPIYLLAGTKDISFKFYQGARHEIINELNRQEVYKDIIDWIKDRI